MTSVRCAPSGRRGSAFLVLACVAALVSTWTGISVGGINLIDYALVMMVGGIVLLALSGARVPIPLWFLTPAIGAVVALVADTVVRNNPAWIDGWTFVARTILSTLVVAVALAVLSENLADRGRLIWVIRAWVIGTSLSAGAAILFTRGQVTLGFVNSISAEAGDRASGFTFHPNALAFSLIMAMPACAYFALSASRWWASVLWAAFAVVCSVAMIDANSRIGIVVGFVGTAMMVVRALVERRSRAVLLPLVAAGAVVIFFTLVPMLIATTRLAAGEGDLSNAGRSSYNSTAWEAFLANPIFGSGFAAQIGVSSQLQLLSAGGLALFLAQYYFIGVLARNVARSRSTFNFLGLTCIAAVIAFGLFQPTTVERSTYWIPLSIMFMTTRQWDGLVGVCDRRGAGAKPSLVTPSRLPEMSVRRSRLGG